MPHHFLLNFRVVLTGLTVLQFDAARADFVPIPLMTDSFNQDVVVEKTANPPMVTVTTASMEMGAANTGFSFYERGYHVEWPSTGLPPAGTRFTSEALVDHDYQFAPSYKSNNAVLLDTAMVHGTLTLSEPAACTGLSFLTCGGNGSSVIGYSIHHEDGSVDTGSFSCPDWRSAVGQAWTTYGRIDVTAFTFADLGSAYPRVYSRDVSLTNTLSPVTAIDLSYLSGSGHAAVFGVSGAALAGDAFAPLLVTGFNQDVVVEAGAAKPGYLPNSTTASMDSGIGNTLNTWYEQGYVSIASTTGLPPAGSTLTNAAAPDHRFQMPSSYKDNNAIMVDSASPDAVLVPATPLACSALSFLGAAGHGPVTNSCVAQHSDGTAETNRFVLPDWLDTAPAAFIANGRVNLNNRFLTSLNAGSPRLFTADVLLANASSPVTNILVSYAGGNANAHAVVFALSGSTGVTLPPRPTIAISLNADATLTITSTAAGTLQSTSTLNGTNTIWRDEGRIATTVTVTPQSAETAKFFRVLAQ